MYTQREKNEHFATMKRTTGETVAFALFALIATVATTLFAVSPARADDLRAATLARGEYLVRLGGCNDCHTAGYAEAGGNVPKTQWLQGQPVGFQGPWGVSYPANLRLRINALSEEQWVAAARAPRLPPMPWFALRDMTDADLKAIYAFVRSLGAAGEEMPAAVAPGGLVKTPVIVFVPVAPSPAQARN